ncbi:SDR family oxidoreductase [Flavobacterium sp. 14A]|uniref:SDR family oxidoreductase n=1 Tax=Flavobacterium sp. 14A TaxID=2735896 RepID=UPI001C2DCEAC|nr:SDR family oxidoreductase [Flavobacterium sp. 14A]NRT10579.1 NAD(P)-dependent dehydrogenase (short-subunit alcohol dehydrogenase family) [Flavobacterium sp. 14A]
MSAKSKTFTQPSRWNHRLKIKLGIILCGAREPEDIAKIVLLLRSDEAKWMTGQNIGANGGTA